MTVDDDDRAETKKKENPRGKEPKADIRFSPVGSCGDNQQCEKCCAQVDMLALIIAGHTVRLSDVCLPGVGLPGAGLLGSVLSGVGLPGAGLPAGTLLT